MNSNKFSGLVTLLLSFVLFGCEETELPVPKSEAPTVRVISPKFSDESYSSGESVLLQVQFDDDIELHEMAIYVTRLHDGTTVYEQHLHQHGNSYRWIDNPTFTTQVESEFEVKAIVTDHDYQRIETSETFTVNP